MTLMIHGDDSLTTLKAIGEDTLTIRKTGGEDALATSVVTHEYVVCTPNDVNDNPCDDINDKQGKIHSKAYGCGHTR